MNCVTPSFPEVMISLQKIKVIPVDESWRLKTSSRFCVFRKTVKTMVRSYKNSGNYLSSWCYF